MLGLPDAITACLFDLDGVLTDTASVHNAAWTRTFDDFLEVRSELHGVPFVPFDPVDDYAQHVDGKPREAGVRDFLASRGIHLAEGTPDDEPGTASVWGVGNRKNELVLEVIRDQGVAVFEGSRRYLEAAAAAGMRRAVVSSSANTAAVLERTGLAHLVELRVDGLTIREESLRGKPSPDTFLLAAERLGVTPAHAAVFEDAIAGVEAGRSGKFGIVVGVDRSSHVDGSDETDRHSHAHALRHHGADVVVDDLADLLAADKA